MLVSCICQNPLCHTSFFVKRARVNQGGGKYCCHACSSADRLRTTFERFWDYVTICSHGYDCMFCCWEWQGKRNNKGYGLIGNKVNGKWMFTPAQRIAWEDHHNRLMPASLMGLHHCDNRSCVNFDHIYAGTAHDNTQDALRRNRFPNEHYWKIARGSDFVRSKLTEEIVILIRQRHARGEQQKALAAIYGVSTATICLVINRKIWTHVL
jgi:HNH endonuclease